MKKGGDDKMVVENTLNAPVPKKNTVLVPMQAGRPSTSFEEDRNEIASRNNTRTFQNIGKQDGKSEEHVRRPSYSTIEKSREEHFNLDYPEDENELARLHLNKHSRFFARNRPRTLDLPSLLPYDIEKSKDRAKFLSHIVSHLYIAIRSLDIQGSLSITVKELAALKNVSGLSDIDLALETNLFEVDNFNQEDISMDDENEFMEDFDDSESDIEYEINKELDEGEEEDDEESTVQHRRSPKSAAIVSVRIWTHELLVWLKMKYTMPLKLRVDLARVYYTLSLCRGQSINIKLYVRTFELLTKDIPLIKSTNLNLDWKSLCYELENHFSLPDASLDHFEKKDHKQLVRLAERASNFISPDASPEIFSRFGSKFSIGHASKVFSSLSLMPIYFTKEGESNPMDVRHYISAYFSFWSMLTKSNEVDSHLTSRLGSIAMASLIQINSDSSSVDSIELGPYGLFDHEQMKFIMNTLLNSLKIMGHKYGSLKSKFFHGYASIVIYSINKMSLGDEKILPHFFDLLNAVQSYINPQNSGEWSRSISKFVLAFVYQFHKRYNQENEEYGELYNLPQTLKLSTAVVDEFVQKILPVLRIGVQSKKNNISGDYLTCFHLLAHMRPKDVIEYVLLDIYESMEGLISTHRVSVALRLMSDLVRHFVATPVIRVHLTRILMLSLPGIDSNDLPKTVLALNLFSVAASFVPFQSLAENDDDEMIAAVLIQEHLEFLERKLYRDDEDVEEFMVHEKAEIRALKSSTAAFKLIMKSLCERIFVLLENIPDPTKSSGIERHLADALPKFLYVIFESLSDDIFFMVRDTFLEYVLNNVHYTLADIVAEICKGIIKRDPKSINLFTDPLMEKIRDEIEFNDAGSSRTGTDIIPRDQALYWNLLIFNECIGSAGEYVVDIGSDLIQLSLYLMEKVKGPVVFASSYLLNQILQTTTVIKLKESKLISPAYNKSKTIDERLWGTLSTDPDRLSPENLDFEWYLPSQREVQFAEETFKIHVSKILQNISSLMKKCSDLENNEGKLVLKLTDDLRLNFLYLSYAISGISYLLDPSFNEDIPKIGQHSTQTIQQRLVLLNQIRGMSDSKSKEDEHYWEDLHENISCIVHDLENMDKSIEESELNTIAETGALSDDNNSPENEIKGGKSNGEQDFEKHDINIFKDVSPPFSLDESGTATPVIDNIDTTAMNPGITFRERKLYTSRYFFGDDIETRKSNVLYIKLHRTYNLIGKSLHSICKFLVQNFHDNTNLIKHFLYVINVWFTDVGKESILDQSNAKINYEYVSSMQRINRIRKPYTRLVVGSRIEAYHNFRVALHATSRSMSEIDKNLLEDVVKLSTSTYSTIVKPAQSTLMDAMKRINGSYNIIVQTTFKLLAKFITSGDHKRLESGLKIFGLKKLRTKMQTDYLNLEKYLEILHQCLNFDDVIVQDLAQALYKNVYNEITSPSSICIINESSIDCIKPPDEFIELEVRAVRIAKERKRKLYLEKIERLEDCVLYNSRRASHWKIKLLCLCLLINIQQDLEIPFKPEAIEFFAQEASYGHPVVSRLALKGLTNFVNKLYVLQSHNGDMRNVFDLNFIPSGIKEINCYEEDGKSFYYHWMKELKNPHPEFYYDQRPYIGWAFWPQSMRVTEALVHLDVARFGEKEKITLESLTKLITKDWLKQIVLLWVTDNESSSAFQGSDVYFISSLMSLLKTGEFSNICIEDILELLESIYVEEDKGTHIVACELISGMLLSSKIFEQDEWERYEIPIKSFLEKLFSSDITPGNRGVWNIFSWWIPSHADGRRFDSVINVVKDFTFSSDSESAIYATRLSFIRSYVAVLTWSFVEADDKMDLCLKNINHKYPALRDQIGSLMAILTFSYFRVSLANAEEFVIESKNDNIFSSALTASNLVGKVKDIFDKIELWRLASEGYSLHDALHTDYVYASSTALMWLTQILNTSASILFQDIMRTHIVPFLLRLTNSKELCQLSKMEPLSTFKMISQVTYTKDNLRAITEMLEDLSKQQLSSLQAIVLGEFTETFYFKNMLRLNADQRLSIIEKTNRMLYNPHAEVRESSASTLSGLIHMSPSHEIASVIKRYIKIYSEDLNKVRSKYRGSKFNKIKMSDSVILHAATLGLGSIVEAFSFVSPPPKWVPEILSILALKSSGIPGIVGKTAKDILGKFRKNRQDTWHVDSRVFSEDQMENLEGVLWKSYFV